MRRSWRSLVFRNHSSHRVAGLSSRGFQLNAADPSPFSPRYLSAFHALTCPHFTNRKTLIHLKNPIAYNLSSEPLVKHKKDADYHFLVSDIFAKFNDANDIEKELELNGIIISHEVVLDVLKSLESNPDVAFKFFNWVLERDGENLGSKAYNLMLGILGVNCSVEEFWGLVETMKKKGYGVSKGTRHKVTGKFQKEGLKSDLERLKGFFASGSMDNSIEKIGLRVSRIVRNQVWGEDIDGKIRDLNVEFSSGLVKIVLENLAMEPVKALTFFRWVEESGRVKHDGRSYNGMIRVLGREDCIDRFWKVVDEMRSQGYEMEVETYAKVLERFVKRKMIKEAVDLYEFAMGGANKPSVQCCTFLLRKIVAGKKLDMDLFSRVVKIFVGCGSVLTDSMLDAVLKSLTSVGRIGECNKVLRELKEGEFVAGGNMQSKIVCRLDSDSKKDETGELVGHMEASVSNLDYKTWLSLIDGHCISGDIEKASDCFQKMVEKEGVSCAGYAFELLVNAYCRKNRAIDACKLLHDYVREHRLKPSHATYKVLVNKLLAQGLFKDALYLLDLMKNHGLPPFVDPFIKYVSKSGTGEDAFAFMKAMTSKKFPSISVVLRMFKAFFNAGRHGEAQDFLSKCPRYICNNADVLNLFCSMKPGEDAAVAAAAT